MKIRDLEIRGFGKINHADVELGNAVNLIYAQNEGGKSTLQAFIRAMFYGVKGGRAGKDGSPPQKQKYKPWKGEAFGGNLVCETPDGETFRIIRNFGTGQARVLDGLFSDRTAEFPVTRERGVQAGEKLLGIPESLYDQTINAMQMMGRLSDMDSREVADRMINLRETGTEDVSAQKALLALKEAMKQQVGSGRTSTRPLDKVNQQIAETEQMIQQKTALMQQYYHNLSDLRAFRERYLILTEEKKCYTEAETAARLCQSSEASVQCIGKGQNIVGKIAELLTQEKLFDKQMQDLQSQRRLLSRYEKASDILLTELQTSQAALAALEPVIQGYETDAKRLEERVRQLEIQLKPLMGYAGMGEHCERDAIEDASQLERLKQEAERHQQENAETKKNEVLQKQKTASLRLRIVGALFVLSAAGGGSIFRPLLVLAGLFAALCFYLWTASRKLRADAVVVQKTAEVNRAKMAQIQDLLMLKHKEVEARYAMTGTQSLESFLRGKSDYDRWKLQKEDLQLQLERISAKLAEARHEANALHSRIRMTLTVVDLPAVEPYIAAIDAFSDGWYGWQALCTEIKEIQNQQGQAVKNMQQLREQLILTTGMQDLPENAEIESWYNQKKIMAEKSVEDSQTAFRELMEQTGAVISGMTAEAQVAQVQQKVQTIVQDLMQCEKQIAMLEGTLRGVPDQDEIQVLRENLLLLNEKRTKLESLGEIFKIAAETLESVSVQMQKEFAPALNMRFADLFSQITGGRYTDSRADEQLGIKVRLPDGDVTSVHYLSGGTADQIYLALRIAAAEALSGGIRLPMILDEPFAQYDDRRTEAALRLLTQLANDRQIIIFTCKRREIELASQLNQNAIRIIELARVLG